MRLGLIVLLAAVFMGQVDLFVVNVAAPQIQTELHASFGQMQLVIGGYVITYAAGMVTGGRLGDRLGRARVFEFGIAGFTAVSLLCALAADPVMLIVGRFVQGAFAAVLMPQVLSTIRATTEAGPTRTKAIGAYGAVIGAGVIAGLLGGGLLLAADVAGLGWRTIFLVNVPIGLLVLVSARRTVPDTRMEQTPRLDSIGSILLASSLTTVLVPLALGSGSGWPLWTWVVLTVGVVGLVGFVAYERRLGRSGSGRPAPVLPLHLFRRRGFSASMACVVAFYTGNAGLFLVATYHLQAGLHLPPLATGLAFVPLGIGFAVASTLGRRVRRAFGDATAPLGAGLMTVSLLLLCLLPPAADHAWCFALVIGASGVGQGLVVADLITTVLGLVHTDEAGSASGVLNTITQTSMAAGIAVVGTLYETLLGANPAGPAAGLGPDAFTDALRITAGALTGLALTTVGLLVMTNRRTTRSRLPSHQGSTRRFRGIPQTSDLESQQLQISHAAAEQ